MFFRLHAVLTSPQTSYHDHIISLGGGDGDTGEKAVTPMTTVHLSMRNHWTVLTRDQRGLTFVRHLTPKHFQP